MPHDTADDRTVKEERDRLWAILEHTVRTGKKKEAICACCTQRVAARRRTVTSEMARALILITRAWRCQKPRSWVPIKEIAVRGGDYAKLRYWDLLERLPPEKKTPNQRDAAYWRPTPRGEAFIEGRTAIPKSVYVFDNVVAADPKAKTITIFDALGTHFDWYKLMGVER